MSLEIIFTPKAKDSFLSTITFIQSNWGDQPAERFVDKTYKLLNLIVKQPYMFKAYQGNDVRIGLITRQTSVVYRVLNDHIEVLFFWDNRQEPAIET
ncbi:MAG: type II toxin-antitoxin system RelE/ParE family toxin [Bacteroidetes bacterium]|nr:type II toxin-antitoxin system RelE/ParE family toxin [Bacteroidota bacterium]